MFDFGRSDIILDMLSLERNYILIKTFAVGGPSERVIPPRELADDRVDSFKYPLFSEFPPPDEYFPQMLTKPSIKQGQESTSIEIAWFIYLHLISH